jgi:hypothetical protein
MNCLCLLCLMCLCGNQGSNGCGTAASTLENTTRGCNPCAETPEPYVTRNTCDEPRPEYRGNRGPRPIYAGQSAQEGGCGCN